MGRILKIKFALLLWFTFIFIEFAWAASSFQKGICFATWEKERYNSQHSDKSLETLAQTGAEWVAIITTYYQDKYNSKQIFPTEKTPSDKSLIHAINKAHRLGLGVMLKPHIDLLDSSGGLWRADIGFQNQADWQEWFQGYLKFILHYAKLAQESGVELLCIGTELKFASQKSEFWRNFIIPNIRKIYSGGLIYAANWDEYGDIRFWNELDYAGIDAYFPLIERRGEGNGRYEEIEAAWKKYADEIEDWQRTINKPVIFTEIGYRSYELCALRPWDSAACGNVDFQIQADCYKAALNIIFTRSWCKGVYWWYWKTSSYAGGLNNRDFTPQNKPAQTVLALWYKGLSLARAYK